MRFADFMLEQKIERRVRQSRSRRARPRRNGAVAHPPKDDADVCQNGLAKNGSIYRPREFEPPRPDDEQFCRLVETEIAEARRRCQELVESWKSHSPS